MYSWSDIKTGIKNPEKIWEELGRLPYKTLLRAHRLNTRVRNQNGIDVMAEDWDNLIILDACRFDTFQARNTIDGSLQKVRSKGSATPEWLEKNFDGKSFPDTVFVSGNPNLANIESEFADIVPMWEVNWDETAGTAQPRAMVEETLAANEEHPDKRLISMFVQPHVPFLGPKAENFQQGGFTGGGVIKDSREVVSLWKRLRKGELEEDEVYAAYEENLDLALEQVEELVEELDGKTVVTSDHGNVFGSGGVYGHPRDVHLPGLVEVPWLEVISGDRRSVTSVSEDELVSTSQSDDAVVEERLEDLGYLS